MRRSLVSRRFAAALCGLIGVALPSAALAYINAGFRNDGDQKTYETYRSRARERTGVFDEAIRRDPKDAVAHYRRAMVWETIPDYYGPLPDNPRRQHINHTTYALDDYAKAIALNPKFVQAYLRRAWLRWKTSEHDRALADLRQAAAVEPKSKMAHAYLAFVYADCPEEKLRDAAKAKAHARLACEASKYEDGACLQLLACVCAQEGDFAAAVKWQKEAVAVLRDFWVGEGVNQRLRAYEMRQVNPVPFTWEELAVTSK
jgi:tetratricopeptide (TPR) repeat protein